MAASIGQFTEAAAVAPNTPQMPSVTVKDMRRPTRSLIHPLFWTKSKWGLSAAHLGLAWRVLCVYQNVAPSAMPANSKEPISPVVVSEMPQWALI